MRAVDECPSCKRYHVGACQRSEPARRTTDLDRFAVESFRRGQRAGLERALEIAVAELGESSVVVDLLRDALAKASARVGRLRAYGNAIVSEVAVTFIRAARDLVIL